MTTDPTARSSAPPRTRRPARATPRRTEGGDHRVAIQLPSGWEDPRTLSDDRLAARIRQADAHRLRARNDQERRYWIAVAKRYADEAATRPQRAGGNG